MFVSDFTKTSIMEKLNFTSKYSFFVLLLLLGVLNKRILFAAASQHHVPRRARSENHLNRWRVNNDHANSARDDEAKRFLNIQKAHKIPKNFPLVATKEVVLAVGTMGVGKTWLTNAFIGCNKAGTADREEDEYPDNEPGEVGHEDQRISCTKMPNILFNTKEDLLFVDCPGFDDKLAAQSLFIQASVQAIVRNIKDLKAILCLIDQSTLDQTITSFHDIQRDGLNKLVVYLQTFLEHPFSFCEGNLLLVVNKTEKEYGVDRALEALEKRFYSLKKIRVKYNVGIRKRARWNRYGEPMLDFLKIFLSGSAGREQIICVHNIDDNNNNADYPNNFASAIKKIKKIKDVVRPDAIKLALSPKNQTRLIKIILSNHEGMKELSEAYGELRTSICVPLAAVALLLISFLACVSKKSKPNDKTIARLVLLWGLAICVFSCYYFNASYKECIKAEKKVVKNNLREEELYYQFTLLGKQLKQHPILQIYRKAFELRFIG